VVDEFGSHVDVEVYKWIDYLVLTS
jgi:hypothetical protein